MTDTMVEIDYLPDDTAPNEGTFLTRCTVQVMSMEMVIDHLHELVVLFDRMLGGPLPRPVCMGCDQELEPDRLGYVAFYDREVVANSAADPRRYREALKRKTGATRYLIATCSTCGSTADDAAKAMHRRISLDEGGTGKVEASAHAARFSPVAGRA